MKAEGRRMNLEVSSEENSDDKTGLPCRTGTREE